jgi:hypothetical protein
VWSLIILSLLLSLLAIDARSRHGFERKEELRTRLSSPFYQYVERSRRISTIEIEINVKECPVTSRTGCISTFPQRLAGILPEISIASSRLLASTRDARNGTKGVPEWVVANPQSPLSNVRLAVNRPARMECQGEKPTLWGPTREYQCFCDVRSQGVEREICVRTNAQDEFKRDA